MQEGGEALEIKERIKAVRKNNSMNQTAFAEALGTTRSIIKNYEIGKVPPTGVFINLVCTKFGISKDWLETGKGEMKIDLTAEEKISKFVGDALAEEGTFKKSLIQILANLDEEGWKKLDEAAKALLDAQEQSKSGGE